MSGPDLALLAALAAALAAAVVLLRGWRPRQTQRPFRSAPAKPSAPAEAPAAPAASGPAAPLESPGSSAGAQAAAGPEPSPPAPEPWDEAAELQWLVDGTPEIQEIYERIGYPPGIERECERLASELKALIRAEVPDWTAFEAALADAARQLAESEQGGDDPAEARFRSGNEELLREVLRAREDRKEILRLLNRDPVDQLLPFVEQLPLMRNGEVVWRTPMELTLVRRRPSDPDRFQRRLEDLERMVRTAPVRRKPPARETVLAALARLRRDLSRPDAYLPTPVQALAAALGDWLHRSHEPALRRRREELDALLLGMLRVRHAHEAGEGGEDLRAAVRRHAQTYAGQPWMHTPWLTTCALTNLLDAELAAFPGRDRENPGTPAGVVRLVRDEVASFHYDSDETVRRLRQQEEKGFYVHSLVYALLRMNRLPAEAPEEPPTRERRFPLSS